MLTHSGILGGAAVATLPVGANTLLFGSDFISSPRKAIKNRLATTNPINLITCPRREFGNSFYYLQGVAGADYSATTAPDGTNDATNIVGTGVSGWSVELNPFNTVLPAGPYCFAISVRWKGTQDARFRFGLNTGGSGTATTSWQRFTQTFTADGVTSYQIYALLYPAAGATQANFEICDFCIYKGSVDLLSQDNPVAGHLMFESLGHGIGQESITSDGKSVSLLGATGATLSIPTAATVTTAFTLIYVTKKNGSSSSAVLNPIIASATTVNPSTFSLGKDVEFGPWNLMWGARVFQAQGPGLNFERGTDYDCVAVSYDGSVGKVYVNGVLMLSTAFVGSAQNFYDLFIGMAWNGSGGLAYSNYQIAALSHYSRVLTDAEQMAAFKYISGQLLATSGIALLGSRCLIGEGDSIVAGLAATNSAGYFYRAFPSLNPVAHGPNFAISGSTFNNVSSRVAAVDAQIAVAIAGGLTPIVYCCLGANDFAGGISAATLFGQMAGYADARRALGAKFIIGTVLPRTDNSGVPKATFNSLRNAYNAMLPGAVGAVGVGHFDAIADLAGVSGMGADTDGDTTNVANYSLGVHPTDVGHALLAPAFVTAVNSI